MRYLTPTLILLGLLAITAALSAEEQAQTTCPVMKGNKIDQDLYVDQDGKRIHVCCQGCIAKVEEDFDTYAKQLEEDGVTLEEVEPQTTCPVMEGNEIDKDLYVDHDGERIYVCCQGCIGKVEKDFDTYADKLEKEGVSLETVPEEASGD